MIACTKARKFPGVRWCTSRTMAVLPLYLIAIPLRRSFAAAIKSGLFLVEAGDFYKALLPNESSSEQFQPGQILRIDDADGHAAVVDHDQIIDAMTLEQIQDFDGKLVLMHDNGIERH